MARKTKDWQALVKGILKGELARRDLSYADLADKLGEIGIKENRRNITNKVGRGNFSAVFLVQCLEAIGVKTIRIEDE
jgi:3-mercaptopyruvate sulfurtransferase SseA